MTDAVALSVRVADERDITYYGLPSVKSSLWGGLVSGYMFVAGVGGSAQIIATAADLVGDRALAPIVRNGRYIALGATVLGGPLLIIDLHTPQRWYNMLRIFRKTSPMSIGTWVLMSFGSLSAALAAAQFASDHGRSLSRTAQTAIKLLQLPAALAGMAMSTYTGALLSATSTPLWAAAPRRIAAVVRYFGNGVGRGRADHRRAPPQPVRQHRPGARRHRPRRERPRTVSTFVAAAALSRTRSGGRTERKRMGPRLRPWCGGARHGRADASSR